MPANPLIFKNAEDVRNSITLNQTIEISKLYERWADDIGKKAKAYSKKEAPSYWVKERQAKVLEKQLRETSKQVINEAYGIIKNNMYLTSNAIVKDAVEFGKKMGIPENTLSAAFTSVADNSIRNIITGNVYDSGWSLSSRIWGNNEQTLKDVYGLVAQGLAQNTSMYEIAKSIESYVRPSAAKGWNPLLKTKNTQTGEWEYKRIYKKQVDYNAQRLGRTLIQHSYQQSFVAVTKNNPFIESYQWLSNGSRVCEICADRDGQIFEKQDLPLDHPNGMCTMLPVVDPNLEDKIADWFNSEDGVYPEIDQFAKNFGYSAKKPSESAINTRMTQLVNKYGNSSAKTHTAWLNKLNNNEKFAVKEFKNTLNMKWDVFYNKYVYKEKIPKTQQVAQVVKGTVNKISSSTKEMLDKIKSKDLDYMRSLDKTKFLNEKQKEAVYSYSTDDFRKYNELFRLRAQGKIKEFEEFYNNSSSYIQNNFRVLEKFAIQDAQRTTEEVIVRRGTDMGDIAGSFMSGDFRENKNKLQNILWDEGPEKAVEYLNNNFTNASGVMQSMTSSSSYYDRGFDGSVEVIMKVPEGARAMGITEVSHYKEGEGEFLIGSNMGVKFIKAEVSDGHFDSKVRVFLELVDTM